MTILQLNRLLMLILNKIMNAVVNALDYYQVDAKKELRHSPVLRLDYTKHRPVDICLKKANKIPALQIIDLVPDNEVHFYPMLRAPFPCVNSQVKNAFVALEPFLITKQLVLIDPLSGKLDHYYMIISDESPCRNDDIGNLVLEMPENARHIFTAYTADNRYLIVDQDVRTQLSELGEFIEFREVKGA